VHVDSILAKCLILVVAAISLAAAQIDVHSIARRVDDRYNRLHTLQAQFTEIYRGAGIERAETGTLWLKKPGKMRWEYRSPRGKLFLSDGRDAWLYVPGDRQVRRTPVRKLDDLRSPLGFLLGKTRLEKELQGLSVAVDVPPLNTGDLMLRGVPKTMTDRVSQVMLEIKAGDQIARIIIEEVDGSVTEYRFADEKSGLQISDQRFRFEPPAGSELIEGDFGR
jgi:outer membrane lipoprotein carrier protein